MKFNFSFFLISATVTMLAGCAATPASEVKIPKVSMEEAWKDSAAPSDRTAALGNGRVVGAVLRQEQPLPVVSAPDIRMAYIYANPDAEGNMHYGSWVALPIDTFRWLLPEGAKIPMSGAPSATALKQGR